MRCAILWIDSQAVKIRLTAAVVCAYSAGLSPFSWQEAHVDSDARHKEVRDVHLELLQLTRVIARRQHIHIKFQARFPVMQTCATRKTQRNHPARCMAAPLAADTLCLIGILGNKVG